MKNHVPGGDRECFLGQPMISVKWYTAIPSGQSGPSGGSLASPAVVFFKMAWVNPVEVTGGRQSPVAPQQPPGSHPMRPRKKNPRCPDQSLQIPRQSRYWNDNFRPGRYYLPVGDTNLRVKWRTNRRTKTRKWYHDLETKQYQGGHSPLTHWVELKKLKTIKKEPVEKKKKYLSTKHEVRVFLFSSLFLGPFSLVFLWPLPPPPPPNPTILALCY